MDHLSKQRRSDTMKSVGTKGIPIEREVRGVVRRLGYRIASNVTRLPGKPDIVVFSEMKIIFTHGCFWHCHWCKRLPKSNREYWESKLLANKKRDRRVVRNLKKSGWKVLTVWECWKKRPIYMKERILSFLVADQDGRRAIGK